MSCLETFLYRVYSVCVPVPSVIIHAKPQRLTLVSISISSGFWLTFSSSISSGKLSYLYSHSWVSLSKITNALLPISHQFLHFFNYEHRVLHSSCALEFKALLLPPPACSDLHPAYQILLRFPTPSLILTPPPVVSHLRVPLKSVRKVSNLAANSFGEKIACKISKEICLQSCTRISTKLYLQLLCYFHYQFFNKIYRIIS